MPFEFIDNTTAIDRAARRRIRSHVAMGKNAGKTLVRRSRIKKAPNSNVYSDAIETSRGTNDKKYVSLEIERQLGDGLSVLSLPRQVTPESISLVQKGMYSFLQQKHRPNHKIPC